MEINRFISNGILLSQKRYEQKISVLYGIPRMEFLMDAKKL